MPLGSDLFTTARLLATSTPRRPRQADLRRAISTAYYGLFHTLARECADQIVGRSRGYSKKAWQQTYRSLDHGFAKNACKHAETLGFPQSIVKFANAFVTLQAERHSADYDPYVRFRRNETLDYIRTAELAADELNATARSDLRAFVVLVLLRQR